MGNIILKDEFYQIIGAAMEVYNQLGRGILDAYLSGSASPGVYK